MSIKLGVVMDPIATINYAKDTTLAMLLAAQQRGWEIHYFEQKDLFLQEGIPYGNSKKLKVFSEPQHWFELGDETCVELEKLNIILMRKDPPFNLDYIFTTYLLEIAEARGALVVNKPQSLRDANEKMFINWFPQCCPKTLVAKNKKLLREFLRQQQEIVLKPLGGMGGASVFHIQQHDVNANVIIETLTQNETTYVMAQRYIADVIKKGDKRILLIDGKPVPYALARIPAADDFRGNLASDAKGEGVELTVRDRWICEQVGPVLSEKGLLFVGLDLIGDYLTEINVTSPTCARELDAIYNLNISDILLDCLEEKLKH